METGVPGKEKLIGVKGLLLRSCIWFTIIIPFLSIPIITRLMHSQTALIDKNPPFRTMLLLDFASAILIVLFGIFVGISIWARRASGKKLALWYFAIRPLAVIGILAIEKKMSANLSIVSVEFLRGASYGILFREIFVCLMGYLYFKLSRRVRNTFPDKIATNSN